jgi:multidrug efflux pump subunit AcrA (membrane-fusion protein)
MLKGIAGAYLAYPIAELLEKRQVSPKLAELRRHYRAPFADRKAMEATKERERVELALAQEAFERRHLRAPMDGVITKVALRSGESVGPHEPVIALVDTSRVRFMGTVPARAGVQLKLGSLVKIELGQDAKSQTRMAKVVFVSPVTDPSSGLIEVIAEFDNADGSVRPGISGRLLF